MGLLFAVVPAQTFRADCPQIALALTLVLAGCVRTAPAAPRCPPIAGLDAVAKPGALLLFGEIHGTEQIPEFIGDAACAAARRGRVHVGLELPSEDSGLLATFLAGSGDDGLRESKLWRSSSQYGVTSRAMRALLERLREYRKAGAPIDVFFFDDRIHSGLERRDEGMAESISLSRARAPGDLYLVLVGNYHARKSVGAPWDPAMRWMANFLARHERGLITLDVRAPPGTAWVCLQKEGGGESCGSRRLSGSNDPASGRAIKLEPNAQLGYDGVYRLSAMTASPPAFAP